MVRKAKSATVKKIEKYFISTNKPEIAFSEISESVGIGTNKLVGTLTSNPSLFEKTKTQRKSADNTKVTVTYWRHIPEKKVAIQDICKEYELKTSEILPFVDVRSFEIRFKCWRARRDEEGFYNLQDVHNVIKKARHYGVLS